MTLLGRRGGVKGYERSRLGVVRNLSVDQILLARIRTFAPTSWRRRGCVRRRVRVCARVAVFCTYVHPTRKHIQRRSRRRRGSARSQSRTRRARRRRRRRFARKLILRGNDATGGVSSGAAEPAVHHQREAGLGEPRIRCRRSIHAIRHRAAVDPRS